MGLKVMAGKDCLKFCVEHTGSEPAGKRIILERVGEVMGYPPEHDFSQFSLLEAISGLPSSLLTQPQPSGPL